MIKLLFFMFTIGMFADTGTDTFAKVSNEVTINYNIINSNSENVENVELNIETHSYLTLESNLFYDYTVADEESLGRAIEPIEISNTNLIEYKYFRMRIIPYSTYINWDEDFIYTELNYDIYIDLWSSDSSLDPIEIYRECVVSYTMAYFGGTYQNGSITIDTPLPVSMTGNIYFDNSSPEYITGYDDGYSAGVYDTSKEHALFKIFDAVFSVIDNVLQVEILPGIRLWYLLGVPLFFLILQFVLNLFR